jgi:hypothetical protein
MVRGPSRFACAASVAVLIGFTLPRGAAAEPPPDHAPLRVGAMIGIVSLPRPVEGEVFVRIQDLFSVGFSYSDFPAFVADPLLSAVGAKSDTRTARLDEFTAYEADLRVMPFRSAFFFGASFGRQFVKGAVTESTVVGPQTGTVDVSTWYVTPRIGWLWTHDSGLLLGLDFGVQLKLAADSKVNVPFGTPADVQRDVQNLADVGSSYPLPSFHFRIGWIF